MNFTKLSKFFLCLAPLAIIIVTPSTLFPFIVGKYVFFRTTVSLALIFFLLGLFTTRMNTDKKTDKHGYGISVNPCSYPCKSVWQQPLVIAVTVFVFIFVLAGFFGVNPKMSFWSNFERGEGSLQMICLFVFFLLAVFLFREKKDWQKIFWISVVAAVLMISYGVFAGLKYLDAETTIQNINGVPQEVLTGRGGPLYQIFKFSVSADLRASGYRFAGSIGNPAYVAVYLIFSLFFAMHLLIDEYRHRLKSFGAISLIAVAAIFFIFFFLAATRGAFIGLIAAVLAGFIYLGLSLKIWRKRLLIIGVIVLLAIGLLVYFRHTTFIKSIPGSRVFDISFQTENFQNRLVIWQMAIDGFKERPILGWGAENFPYVFDKHYNPKHYSVIAGFGAWYDRAHNIFLDYLISAGILGLMSFLSIFAAFYWQFFSKTRNYAEKDAELLESALLFALPIAYLVQGLVLFDILPTYISLFLFLAFNVYKFGDNPK